MTLTPGFTPKSKTKIMTLTPGFTPATKTDLMNSVSDLALSSAEVTGYTAQFSARIKQLLEPQAPVAANDNRAPEDLAQAA